MERYEILLTQLGEEACEVAQEASKCLRFGPYEVYPEIGISNGMRVIREYLELSAVVAMLQREQILPTLTDKECDHIALEKVDKVEKMLRYSAKVGRLYPELKP
jgi:hypothetical protein